MPVVRVGMYNSLYNMYEGCKYYDRENNLWFSLFYDLLSYNPNTYLTNQCRYNNRERDNDRTQLSLYEALDWYI